ncbi:MAG: sigma-70 family RNA polymerase sigma factor [Anaerolineales bacterium]|jgi:RNA polymerase primary sigma factor
MDLSKLTSINSRTLKDHYIEEITKTPLLTSEEEVELTGKIRAAEEARQQLASGDFTEKERERIEQVIEEGTMAQEKILLANTRLVLSVAKRYTGRGIPLLDLVQEGIIGLMRATKKFEPERGNRFSTYATWWIRQAITRSIDNNARIIRLPVHKNIEINKVAYTRNELMQEFGREPTEEEIAEVLEMSPQQVLETMRISQTPISLELPQDDDENRTLADLIPDDEASSPEETTTETIMQEQIKDVLDELPMREARVIMLRYGFQDGRTYTLQEVGDAMGITRERVRQIESQAMNRLRATARNIR